MQGLIPCKHGSLSLCANTPGWADGSTRSPPHWPRARTGDRKGVTGARAGHRSGLGGEDAQPRFTEEHLGLRGLGQGQAVSPLAACSLLSSGKIRQTPVVNVDLHT